MEITYKIDHIPEVDVLIDLFNHSEYFPIHDRTDTERIAMMYENANIVVTAWDGNELIGAARSLCDFCYCCYLSDLCVRTDYRGRGIGQELVRLTRETAGEECKLILQSLKSAADFYRKIGMDEVDSAFMIQRAH